MRAILLGLLLWMAASAAFADSFEEQCEAELPKGDVVVQAKKVEPIMDFSKSFLDITGTTQASLSDAQFAMGATVTSLSRDIQTDFHGKHNIFGRLCIRAKLKVVLSYSPMTVYIAKEFGEVSCFSKEIFLHEMRHVRTYENFLKGYAVRLQDLLIGAFGQEVYYFDNEDGARRTLQAVVDRQLAQLLNKSIADIDAAQQRIDTKEESERLSRACPSEAKRLSLLWDAFRLEKNWEEAK